MNKYKNRLKAIFRMIIICVLMTSCNKLVEIDLPTNQINFKEVFETIDVAKSALSGLYTNIREESVLTGKMSGMGTLLGLYTDELVSNIEANSKLGINEFYANALLPSNNQLSQLWNNSYKHVYTINSFIEGLINSNSIDEKLKSPLLGEAYFLRALYYHYLCQLFGNIPYVTSTDYQKNRRVGKTDYLEVLDLIEIDLLKSNELIDVQFRNVNRFYPNKASVTLLLAKTYLLKKEYLKAENTVKDLFNINDVEIEGDLLKTFKKGAKSTLWQLDRNSSTVYTYEADNFSFKSFPPSLTLSNHVLSIFASDDDRKKAWINEVIKDNLSLHHSYKYKNTNSNTDENSIVFRIEEAYFCLAEAYIYQDKIELAIKILNAIRQKANIPDLDNSLNKEQVVDELLRELQREFFTEHGHRFFDLKRNGKLSLLHLTKPNWTEKSSLLPIPEKELLLNPNLLPQNNGY